MPQQPISTGHVLIHPMMDPQEIARQQQDDQLAQQEIELRRLNVTSLMEQRRAQMQEQQAQRETEAYLADAVKRHQKDGRPDFDAIIDEAYGTNPTMAMGLEKHVNTQRTADLERRKQALQIDKLEAEVDLPLLDRIVDESTFAVMKPLIDKRAPELSQLIGDTFDPQRLEALKGHALTEKDKIDIELKKADDEFQRMQLKVRERELSQQAADAQANRALRGREIAVQEGNLQERRKDAAKPPAAAGGKTGPDVGAIIGKIEALSKNINTGEGGIGSVVKGAARSAAAKGGYDNDVAQYEALVEGMIPMVARAVGHTGVLTQQDVDSVRKLFPTTKDNKALAESKLKTVKELIAGKGEAAAAPGATNDPMGIRKGGG